MAWSTPKEWSGDELLTASDLNQYVSDNLSALYALVQGGGRKNLLMNGACQVHQRVAVAATTAIADQTFAADRWNGSHYRDAGSTWTATMAVEADAPTGSGFRKSLKVNVTAADASLAAADVLILQQKVEGQNLQSIKKGTTSAEQVTLSFWAKSNKTGVYVAELVDADNSRTVSAAYTISASATWEQKVLTFPADLTGSFTNDADYSLGVNFWLLCGSNFSSGTLATTWATLTSVNRAVGQTNLAADTSNYWQLTGAQLEIGSAATGYEFKDYGTELSESQRYYYTSKGTFQVPSSIGLADSTSRAWFNAGFPTTMRDRPTVTLYDWSSNAGAISNAAGTTSYTTATATAEQITKDGFTRVDVSGAGLTVGVHYWLWFTASAEIQP